MIYRGFIKVNQNQLELLLNHRQLGEVLQFCNQNNIKCFIVGATPVQNELIVSLRKIETSQNQNIHSYSRIILQSLIDQPLLYRQIRQQLINLDQMLVKEVLFIQVEILVKNAGGLNVVKYGLIRNYILSLEVVLPNGKILNLLKIKTEKITLELINIIFYLI
ncbi:unnamed protein product [Paramecium primaurelia]|uniref:FAD linked oxidase N-terminal domain-containing protein n=1 Tax=Paramecium primaurelia TaxID=5886 RepID=A0A8S1Q946_PARPR|nr:unnamed protein product [Paramecium primaurelia]